MISLAIRQDYDAIEYDRERIERLIREVCQRFERTEGGVSVALLGDDQMIALNRRFMQLDRTTDCFSFDLSDEDQAGFSFEVLVNAQLAVREAAPARS